VAEVDGNVSGVSLRPMFLGDDHTDAVTKVIGEAKFLYEPPVVNG